MRRAGGTVIASPGARMCSRPSITSRIVPSITSWRSVWPVWTCAWVRKPRARPTTSNSNSSPSVSSAVLRISSETPSLVIVVMAL